MVHIPYGFSEEQLNAVQLFADVLTSPRELNVVEEKIIQDLIAECLQGKEFNIKAVRTAIDSEEKKNPLHRACCMLLDMHFYARNLPKFPLTEKWIEDDRLRIVGLLRDLTALSHCVAKLRQQGMLGKNWQPDICKNMQIARDWIEAMEKKSDKKTGAGFLNRLRRQETQRGQLFHYFRLVSMFDMDAFMLDSGPKRLNK